MKTLISTFLALSLVLLAALLGKELILDAGDTQFGYVSAAAATVLGGFAAFGLVSLLLLRRHADLVQGIWLSLASVLVAYVIADFLAGQLLLERLSPPTMKDDLVHHKLQPDTLSEFNSSDFSYVQRVNNLGLRGEDVDPAKKTGTYRILMLGDSFTMGKGVEDGETFSVLLEKSLDSAERPVEVLNAGVDSYSPILSYRQLATQVGPLLEPDLVVLNFDMSDLIQEVAYRKIAILDGDGEIVGFQREAEESGPFVRARRFIDNNFYFARLALYYFDRWGRDEAEGFTVENTVALANPDLVKHTLKGDTVDRAEQWRNVFDSILKIKRYCEDRDVDFLLTVYPWGHQVSEDEWVPGREVFVDEGSSTSDRSIEALEAFATRNSVDFIDLFPIFRAYDGESPLYFDFDMHWTTVGHQLMASELNRYVSESYLGGRDR